MIIIKDELIIKLQARLDDLWKTHGRYNSKIDSISDLANLYLDRYLSKVIQKEQNNKNNNLDWMRFKRVNYKFIYEREKGRCYYCKQRLAIKDGTLDHKTPPSRGGNNVLENVCLCCAWCNNDKGILKAGEYFYKQLVNAADGIKPPKP